MNRPHAAVTSWARRARRHTWVPDTRDPAYSAGRLMRTSHTRRP